MCEAEYDRPMNEPTPPPIPANDPIEAPLGTPSRQTRVRGVLRIVGVFVAIGLLVVLTLQNTDPVDLHLLVWTVTLSRALLVFAVIVVGVVLGWVLRSMRDDDGFRLLG